MTDTNNKQIMEVDLDILAAQIEKHVDHEIKIVKTTTVQDYKPDQLVVICNTCQAPLRSEEHTSEL